MFFTFLIVVILTAIALVVVAMTIAKLIAPRSFNPQKGEPYECGIPTRGQSWVQFKVGYYLFAILFLMFDINSIFVSVGSSSQRSRYLCLVCVAFFLLVLILAWHMHGGKEHWNGSKKTSNPFNEIR